jgi:acyl-coenzyme A synthetase/AMP-(fatty) acid ligase
MIPERIDLRETLPKTSTGKIDRVKLAAESRL